MKTFKEIISTAKTEISGIDTLSAYLIFGSITDKQYAKGLKLIRKKFKTQNQTLKQKNMGKSPSQVYNESIQKLTKKVAKLQKENDDLIHEIAIANKFIKAQKEYYETLTPKNK